MLHHILCHLIYSITLQFMKQNSISVKLEDFQIKTMQNLAFYGGFFKIYFKRCHLKIKGKNFKMSRLSKSTSNNHRIKMKYALKKIHKTTHTFPLVSHFRLLGLAFLYNQLYPIYLINKKHILCVHTTVTMFVIVCRFYWRQHC